MPTFFFLPVDPQHFWIRRNEYLFLRASAKKGKVRWPPSATQAGKEDIFNFFFNEMRIRDGSFSHNSSSENDELSHKIKWLIFFFCSLSFSLSLCFWNKANKNCIYRMNQISQQFLKENIFFFLSHDYYAF